jgi:superoxide reductase
MTKIDQMYKCKDCGNLVSIVEAGGGNLICCGKPMSLLMEYGIADEKAEKHVPVLEAEQGDFVIVKVGSISHPMDKDHYIELIQLMQGDNVVMGKRLKPGDKPEVRFYVSEKKNLKARALCNVHGIWKSK